MLRTYKNRAAAVVSMSCQDKKEVTLHRRGPHSFPRGFTDTSETSNPDETSSGDTTRLLGGGEGYWEGLELGFNL
jgi:hypothetical protein